MRCCIGRLQKKVRDAARAIQLKEVTRQRAQQTFQSSLEEKIRKTQER